MIAVELCFRADIGQVGAGIRFGKSLAPDLVGAQNIREKAPLLGIRSERNDGGTDQHQSQDIGQRRRSGTGHLFGKNHLFHQGGAASAVFLRPCHTGPSRFEYLLLPSPKKFESRVHFIFRAMLFPIGWNVGLQPCANLVAKAEFGRSKVEIHGSISISIERKQRLANI